MLHAMRVLVPCAVVALLISISPVFAAAAPAPTRPAPAGQAVDLELVIMTDTSGSIERQEAMLQRQGIAAAFRSAEVVPA